LGRPNLPQFDSRGEEAGQGDDPPNEEDGAMERESYWSDDDGSSSDEYKSKGGWKQRWSGILIMNLRQKNLKISVLCTFKTSAWKFS